jgi:hypothetical protein
MQCERIGCNIEARYITREGRHYCFACRPTFSLPEEYKLLLTHIIQTDIPK